MRPIIVQFFKSYNFTKGLLISCAAFSAIAICYFFLNMTIGAGAALGVLLISASDIPGNKKHHLNGMLISLLLAITSFIIIHYTMPHVYLLVISLAVLVFINSYISVYGFRASLIAFSGLLAISLSFAHPLSGMDIWYNALYIIGGGMWYLVLSQLVGKLRTQQYSDQLLTECMELTSSYLKTRVASIAAKNRENALNKQLALQNEINEKHETLRAILLHQRQRSGGMYSKRKQLMLFIELIDIHEFAVANPLHYKKYDMGSQGFKKAVDEIAITMNAIANRLQILSNRNLHQQKGMAPVSVNELIANSKMAIEKFKQEVDVKRYREEILQLRNLLDYTEKQHQKVTIIKRILTGTLTDEISERLKNRDRLKFITPQDYSPKLLMENLTLKSPIFKHSLRLVVTVLAGYLIGTFFSLQNAYWIILTIIVIMRPGYVLTKDRSQQRIIGTLIGGAIAVGIVLLTNNIFVYMGITFVAMTLAFTFVQQNYKASAVFITLTIVFVYAMLSPNTLGIIQFRVVDTLVGAILASVANLLLWPTWEKESIQSLILEAIATNKAYLEEAKAFYHDKTELKTSYKLSRKQTFIAIGNLHAGFQRMTQEPKWQQQNLNRLYEIVVTLNSLLSTTASMGTYIQIHHTTDASEYFDAYMNSIIDKLTYCEAIIHKRDFTPQNEPDLNQAKNRLAEIYNNLSAQRNEEIDAGQHAIKDELREQLKEVRIISEQLEWLYALCQNLHAGIKKYMEGL
ncbi:FUSC family protein [Galbibacter pacificus]|uniref:FUSC family protein n=1 Tax=Galbibacter pacificus TaxID=2996052 RepID=A0ABT6FMB1_9FLAO|nr:FUSC family membrane protein [Galbibacter pacificus]MDG3580919.1 FUSC family membrane protein [Galbibacter pacificus]MDG3584397.1 FUSC family protein [Galbibacter pacificus]